MELKACPLCYYQRTFVMGVVGVLGIGLLNAIQPASLLSLLSLPVATAALGVSGFHVFLELSGKLECPPGIEGYGSAPQQALAALAILFLAILADAISGSKVLTTSRAALFGGILLGALLAFGAIASAPPAPPPPTEPYNEPLQTCRPPYRATFGDAESVAFGSSLSEQGSKD
jgi:disulfide bond formation protein DsbB